MRSLVYEISLCGIPVASTLSYNESIRMKALGYQISTKMITKEEKPSALAKKWMAKKFALK